MTLTIRTTRRTHDGGYGYGYGYGSMKLLHKHKKKLRPMHSKEPAATVQKGPAANEQERASNGNGHQTVGRSKLESSM